MIQAKAFAKIFELTKVIQTNRKVFLKFEDNEVKKINVIKTTVKATILNYDKGIKSINWSPHTTIVTSDHLWIGKEAYIKRLNKDYPVLEESIKALCLEFKLSRDDSLNKIIFFIDYLLFQQKDIYDELKLAELSSVLISDLKKIPPDWKVKLWIKGIWVDSPLFIPKYNILVRRPVDDDFEFVVKPLDEYMMPYNNTLLDHCDSILEFEYNNARDFEVNKFIEDLIKALTLFRLGSLRVTRRECLPNSILTNYNCIRSFKHTIEKYSYELLQDDDLKLNQFFDLVLPVMPDHTWMEVDNKNNSIFIAIERYLEAITKHQNLESRITKAITCLEALFLKANERSELSHKLSQRVALLLQRFKHDPIKIYSDIKRAYEVRSIYIHGSILLKDARKDLEDLSNICLDYARQCIVDFIKLSDKYSKEAILPKIDNAILDARAKEKFNSMIPHFDF